jgi:hypothetical protein
MQRLTKFIVDSLFLAAIVPLAAAADKQDSSDSQYWAKTPACSNHRQRFADGGDGTVTDCSTGLMWDKKTAYPAADLTDPRPHLNSCT